MKQWYEALFENYGNRYDLEPFTQGTFGECDFVEKELNFDKNLRILDIGCGTGRHTIELSKRGYDIFGIDLSDSQLAKAREKANALGMEVPFFKHDARHLPFISEFDAAIMLCEGAFPLMETDVMNYRILENAKTALKGPGSKFIFTTLNGLFPLFHSIKDYLTRTAQGTTTYEQNTFDVMTFRDRNVATIIDDSGDKIELTCNERYYIPSEITWMLKCLGFGKIDIFGAKLGAFSRSDKLTPEDFEMLVVAEI
jgi:SAM-dependent methyltransferase